MESEKIKAVVFDCDGVMFDTAKANRMFYNAVLEQFGKPPLDDEQFIKVHMDTVQGALTSLFPEMESLEPVYRFIKKTGYHGFIRYMDIEPGLKELLKRLKSSGYIRAVATNRTNTMASVLTQYDLDGEFDMVVTAADVEHAKPAPDQLLSIMARFHLRPDEILFIGDSSFDQKAARSAGTVFAAFRNSALTADYHCSSMSDVQKLLALNV